ncbi:transcriptional regulator [Janthinobacterium sp. GB4P2]|uniref:transcriptional regulator n=1 Tax=Janthinobacterium sp. GB4P2 TaxID=3424189 RepID=UPI003F208904
MTLSEYFALAHGNQAAFVKATGLAQAFASSIALGGRPVPAEHGAAIERATGGQVTRQELFPDSWARIWPELVAPATDLPGKFSGNCTIDHAVELRGAIAQTRLVFEGHRDAQDALEYLEQVLKAGQRAEVPAHACTPAPSDSRGVDVLLDTPACKSAPPRDNSALAQIKRELFTAADQLQQPADLVVQLLVLAELRSMRAEQASDRFARGAAVLS